MASLILDTAFAAQGMLDAAQWWGKASIAKGASTIFGEGLHLPLFTSEIAVTATGADAFTLSGEADNGSDLKPPHWRTTSLYFTACSHVYPQSCFLLA